jgi:predicted Fe-S protein YdhL (DUF1289 family)
MIYYFMTSMGVVPKDLGKSMIKIIHCGHGGIQGCLRRARELLFWPGMSSEVKDFVSNCSTCNDHRNNQQNEPLLSHEVISRPWAKIGVDLFQFGGRGLLTR